MISVLETAMYMPYVVLLSWLPDIVLSSTYFGRASQGIINMLLHPIPSNTTTATFSGNSISEVPAGYLQNIPNLDHLYLYNNEIANISDFAFIGVPSVGRIDLEGNKLKVIRKYTFYGLHNLWSLTLHWNELHTVESEGFADNPSLWYLYLNDNSLDTLVRTVFNLTNHPTNLANFKIQNNPLMCESLCWLMLSDGDWITVLNPDQVVCAGAGHLNGQKWKDLTANDLCEFLQF